MLIRKHSVALAFTFSLKCCCVTVTGFSAKNNHKIVYPNLNFAMRPVPHDDYLSAPEPPQNGLAFLEQMECEDGSSPEAIQHSSDDHCVPQQRTSEPKQFYQQELNGLIQDLSLS
jgi:hypothetical protein